MNIFKDIINIAKAFAPYKNTKSKVTSINQSENINIKPYQFSNVNLAEQLFNNQILGGSIDSIYKSQVIKILKQCTPENKKNPEKQQVLLKIIELIGEPKTPKERFLIAKAYAWSRVQYREQAIYYLELYLNNELWDNAPAQSKLHHLNEMYGYLAKAYIGTYNFDKALGIYEYLITIFPQNPTAYRGKYNCLIKQNKLKECSLWIDSLKKLPYYKLNINYSQTSQENWFYFTINELEKDIKEKNDKNYVYKSKKK